MLWGANASLFWALLFLNVLSLAAWVWKFLRARKQPERANLILRFLTALVLSIAFGLGTLPSDPPFQPNHSFGIGLLSCSVGSSIVFWLGALKARVWLSYLGVFLPFAVPLTLSPGDPFPSLFGLMSGTMLFWFCLGETWRPYGLTVISLVAAIGLARHYEQPPGLGKYIWQALPLSLTFSGWLGVGMWDSWQRYWQNSAESLEPTIVPSVLLIVGSAFMSYWSGDWRFLFLVLLACIAALTALEVKGSQLSDFVVLIWVGLLVLCFAVLPEMEDLRLFGGYGVALAAVVLSWLAVVEEEDEQSTLNQGAIILTSFALFRLFSKVYPLSFPRADLYTHYTFVGFLLGTTIPILLARQFDQRKSFVHDLVVGFWAATIPAFIGAIWGVKAVVGYLAGSIAASLLSVPFNPQTLLAGFATSLPVTALVEPASDLPRKVRLWFVVLSLLAFAFSLWLERFFRGGGDEAKQI